MIELGPLVKRKYEDKNNTWTFYIFDKILSKEFWNNFLSLSFEPTSVSQIYNNSTLLIIQFIRCMDLLGGQGGLPDNSKMNGNQLFKKKSDPKYTNAAQWFAFIIHIIEFLKLFVCLFFVKGVQIYQNYTYISFL